METPQILLPPPKLPYPHSIHPQEAPLPCETQLITFIICYMSDIKTTEISPPYFGVGDETDEERCECASAAAKKNDVRSMREM